MGGKGSRIALGLAVALTAFGAMVTSANAAAIILPSPDCCTFEAGPFEQAQGEIAILDNSATTAPHDVRSTQNGPDGGFLFQSAAIAGGDTAPVTGSQYLTAGTYPFYCTIHGPSMSGELTVNSSGTAVKRPAVKVSILRQRLKRVRKSGIKVRLKATAAAKGVTVIARKGKKVLGTKRKLNFKAGQARIVTIRLTKAGRKAIRRGKAVKVSVQAKVPYGKPSKSTRKLR